MDSEARDVPVDWGMPDTSNGVHPIYFAKHMTKVLAIHNRMMNKNHNQCVMLCINLEHCLCNHAGHQHGL